MICQWTASTRFINTGTFTLQFSGTKFRMTQSVPFGFSQSESLQSQCLAMRERPRILALQSYQSLAILLPMTLIQNFCQCQLFSWTLQFLVYLSWHNTLHPVYWQVQVRTWDSWSTEKHCSDIAILFKFWPSTQKYSNACTFTKFKFRKMNVFCIKYKRNTN